MNAEDNINQSTETGSKKDKLTRVDQFLHYMAGHNNNNEVVLNEVEEFLDAYKSDSIVFTAKAQELIITITEKKKGLLGGVKDVIKQKPFCDALSSAITDYQSYKEINYELKWTHAFNLLDLVQRGKVFGAIKNKVQQETDYANEIESLNQKIDNLQKLNNKLLKENKQLHNLASHDT